MRDFLFKLIYTVVIVLLFCTVIVIEEPDKAILSILNDAVPQAEKNFGQNIIAVHISTVQVDRSNVDSSYERG